MYKDPRNVKQKNNVFSPAATHYIEIWLLSAPPHRGKIRVLPPHFFHTMEQLWAHFSTQWNNFEQKFHTVENRRVPSPSPQDAGWTRVLLRRRSRPSKRAIASVAANQQQKGHSPILVSGLGSAPSMRDRAVRLKTQKSLTKKMPRVYKVWTAP